MKSTGKAYSEACEVAGRSHTFGPPWPHIFLALPQHLASLPPANEKVAPTLKLHWNSLMQGNPREDCIKTLQDQVRYCRIKDCWYDGAKPTHCKLQLMMPPYLQATSTEHNGETLYTVDAAIGLTISNQGGLKKAGSPPKGALERGAEKLLRQMGYSPAQIAKHTKRQRRERRTTRTSDPPARGEGPSFSGQQKRFREGASNF
ncbi:unnamed protein product [Prorocentrum cordatum]|uniref:Uncharacterized protein n=1 Tax=Prorocentrum cordatum TaxID=2364126 RepID=A0ABN9W0R1_9DINO|nr:unnamed protein product [Polarella glacialis]